MVSGEWKQTEVAYLAMNYPSLGPDHCAKQLGRTKSSVHMKASKLGIKYAPEGEATPTAYSEGRLSHGKGTPLRSCPNLPTEQAAWWKAGWHDADAEAGNSWL